MTDPWEEYSGAQVLDKPAEDGPWNDFKAPQTPAADRGTPDVPRGTETVPQEDLRPGIRREAFQMMNQNERLSPAVQRNIADYSSGAVGDTMRVGKNILGRATEKAGYVTDLFMEKLGLAKSPVEARNLNDIQDEDDLIALRNKNDIALNNGDYSGTVSNFVKYFEGKGVTDGKEMMTLLKDSIRENKWDPTSDDDSRVLSDGSLRINPKFIALPDSTQGIKAIEAASVPQDVKDREIENFWQARKLAAKSFDEKAKGYDADYRKHAEEMAAKGVTDPEQVFYSWPGLNRNWIEGSWDVVRDTVAEAGRGITNTGRGIVAGGANLVGAKDTAAALSRSALESKAKSGYVNEIAAARGEDGAIVGSGKELGSTVLEMAPMFIGGAVGRLIKGGLEAGAARQILGKITTGTSVYGYAGAQGYASLMQTALEKAQDKAHAEGRELTGDEINSTVRSMQGAALANGLQTAILSKLLPEGVEKTAIEGLTAKAGTMTGREVLGALREKYGEKGLRAALQEAKPELLKFTKQAYEAGKTGFKDEALEESLNQYLEGVITKSSGADADKSWDDIGQESFKAGWMGGVIGAALPVAQQTLAQIDPNELAARQLVAGAQEHAPVAATAASEPLDPDETTETPAPEVQESPLAEGSLPPETAPLGEVQAEAPAANQGGTVESRLSDLSEKWKDQGVRLDLSIGDHSKPGSFSIGDTDGAIKLDLIKVPEDQRRQGIGSKAINELKAVADATGRPVELFPTVTDTGLPELYERLGFERYERTSPNNGSKRQDGYRYTPKPVETSTQTPDVLAEKAGPESLAPPAEESPVNSPQPDVPVPVTDPNAYSKENLRTTFNLSPEQAEATDTLVQAMGLDTSQILLKKGGTPGKGLAGQENSSGQGFKGSFERLANSGKALLRGLSNPNVSTGIHELSHVARQTLFDRESLVAGITPEDIDVAEAWAGAKDGTWDTPAEEKFARGFERYLRDGEAPDARLKEVFSKIADWFRGIYQKLTGGPLDVQITPAMKAVFDALVTRGKLPEVNSGTTVETPVNQGSQAEKAPETGNSAPPPADFVDKDGNPVPAEDVIGIRKSMTDAYREANGLLASTLKVSQSDQQAVDEASQRVAEHAAWDAARKTPGATPGPEPLVGQALIADLANNPGRPANKTEKALLAHELLLKDQAFHAAKNTLDTLPADADAATRKSATAAYDRAVEDTTLVLDTLRLHNSMAGLALQAAKLVTTRQFELVQMLSDYQRWQHPGDPSVPLTPSQKAEVEALHERVKAAEKALDDYKEQAAANEARRIHEAEQAARKKAKPEVRKALGSKIEEAKKRLREQGFLKPEEETPPGEFLAQEDLPEQTLEDLATFGAGWLIDKDPGLKNFTNRVKRTFGDKAAPHAEAIYAKAKEILGTQTDAVVSASTEEEAPAKGKSKEQILADIDEVTGNDVFQLARAQVNAGVEGFENVMKGVLADLQTKFPDLTLREVHDAYSGYGKVVRPSKADDLVKLREYRSLARLTSQLEDATKAVAPLRTGLQRDKATEKVRTLQKQVKEMMRKMGIKATGSKSLTTSLEAVKNRLKNEIEELDAAVKNKTPLPEKGQPAAYDAEATKLKGQRDAKKAEYDALFPKAGETEDEAIEKAEKSLDRRIQENEDLVKQGLAKKPVNLKDRAAWSKEISEKRAKLEELLKQRKALRDATAERLDRAKKLAEKRIEKIRKRIANQDFAPPGKKTPIVPDAKLAELQNEEFHAKREWDKKRGEALLAKASAFGKGKYYGKSLLSLQRIIKLGGEFGVVARQLFPFFAKAVFQPKVALDALHKAGAATFSRTDEQALYSHWSDPNTNPDSIWYKNMGIILHGPHSEHTGFKEDIPDPELLERMAEMKGAGRILGLPAEALLGIERFTRTAINAVRVAETHNLIQAMRGGTPTAEEAKVIGNAVMNSTGRYAFKNQKLDSWVGAANLVTISARWALSRMAMHLGQPIWTTKAEWKGTGAARYQIAKELYAKPLAGYATLALIGAALLGRKKDDDEEDKNSLNLDPGVHFGEGKIFGKRFDYSGGVRPYSKLGLSFLKHWGHRLMPDKFDAPKGDLDNEVKRFFENRRNPVFAWAYDTVVKDAYYGKREKNIPNSIDEFVTPVILKDAFNLATDKELNVAQAALLFAMLQSGVSMQTQQTQR